VLEVSFDHPVTFDHVLTMEWLNEGQHVEKYAIEVWKDSERSWQRIVEAEAIGHEKIDAFASVTADRVRLNILSSTGEAHIREFQLFNWSKPSSGGRPHAGDVPARDNDRVPSSAAR
jgi:alpha-L-fucosidase